MAHRVTIPHPHNDYYTVFCGGCGYGYASRSERARDDDAGEHMWVCGNKVTIDGPTHATITCFP